MISSTPWGSKIRGRALCEQNSRWGSDNGLSFAEYHTTPYVRQFNGLFGPVLKEGICGSLHSTLVVWRIVIVHEAVTALRNAWIEESQRINSSLVSIRIEANKTKGFGFEASGGLR